MGWTSTSDNKLEAFTNVTVVALKWHSGSQGGVISGFLYHAQMAEGSGKISGDCF
jgi:hypothetical protein